MSQPTEKLLKTLRPVVHALSFPAAADAFAFFVWPYRLLSTVRTLSGVAECLPMKSYLAYSFRVCVNNQVDPFSALIKNRYAKQQVADCLRRAELEDLSIVPGCGWIASGRKPAVLA